MISGSVDIADGIYRFMTPQGNVFLEYNNNELLVGYDVSACRVAAKDIRTYVAVPYPNAYLGLDNCPGFVSGYKAFALHTGWTAGGVARYIRGVVYHTWVKDNPLASRLCYTGSGLSRRRLLDLKRNQSMLDQIVQDGLDNVLPLAFQLSMDPHQMRRLFGKSLWRKLSHQSFTRNRYIAGHLANAEINETPEQVVHTVRLLVEVPSRVFRSIPASTRYFTDAKALAYCGAIKGPMAPGYAGIIADTLRMAAMLGFPEPKPLALYDDWLALHNRYSVELCVKRDARRIQRFNEELGPNEIVTGAWRFERLMTGEQLVEEGEAMHHCVGSYMDACLENRYLVYRAFKDGKHVGTLGMRPNEGVGAVIDQFMGPCNTPLQLSSTEPRQMRAAFTGYPL